MPWRCVNVSLCNKTLSSGALGAGTCGVCLFFFYHCLVKQEYVHKTNIKQCVSPLTSKEEGGGGGEEELAKLIKIMMF